MLLILLPLLLLLMITLLSTVRNRLGLTETETQHDQLLTRAIEATGAAFERRCRRALFRTAGALYEFPADQTELRVACYPVESVLCFEVKDNEIEGWVLRDAPTYVVREECVISLRTALGLPTAQGRVTYVGGYVMPGQAVGAGQHAFPPDLEHAAIEQIAAWFYHRDKVGLLRSWPSGGTFQHFSELPLLPQVEALLSRYERVMT